MTYYHGSPIRMEPGTVQGRWGQSFMAPASRVVRRLDPDEAERRMMATGAKVNRVNQAILKEADQDYSQSAMIALKPSETLRKVYADMHECTEDIEELHITLAYLGEFGTDIEFEQQDLFYRGLYDFALHAGYRGLTGKINGFGVFMNDDANVLVALWDIPGINEFRTHVIDYVTTHVGSIRQDNHGFTPHMTMAYSEEPILQLPRLPRSNPDEEIFVSVWLVWGDEWTEVTLL